eukprot:TRINITY_DN83521_c0_g1_i1.p1 TRINITY_DN83521_c0_g1~~TRINITY_DN83521_c0_g1_i1.p1  ORF type:complete len:443 (-),score=83.77 TRINITY_DN83521_c0_g1_i1:166-1410(-)
MGAGGSSVGKTYYSDASIVSSPQGGEKSMRLPISSPSSLYAKRRPSDVSLGSPTSVTTAAETECDMVRHERGIRRVEDIRELYKFKNILVESGHHGIEVRDAVRLADGFELVVKKRLKNTFSQTTCPEEEDQWRVSHVELLNMPDRAWGHICQIYDVVEDDAAYYVAMERVPGKDLFDTMLAELPTRRLPLMECKEAIRQVLCGLQELHAAGCVHRDLKIENVMFARTTQKSVAFDPWHEEDTISLGADLSVKLIDFDTLVKLPPGPKHNVSKIILGSNQYIAPEAYAGKYSSASDIFAVGVIAYRMITGKFPYAGSIFNDEAGENYMGSPKMRAIQDRVLGAYVSWVHDPFKEDYACMEFVKALMAPEAKQRPTAAEALRDPWLAGCGLASEDTRTLSLGSRPVSSTSSCWTP